MLQSLDGCASDINIVISDNGSTVQGNHHRRMLPATCLSVYLSGALPTFGTNRLFVTYRGRIVTRSTSQEITAGVRGTLLVILRVLRLAGSPDSLTGLVSRNWFHHLGLGVFVDVLVSRNNALLGRRNRFRTNVCGYLRTQSRSSSLLSRIKQDFTNFQPFCSCISVRIGNSDDGVLNMMDKHGVF